MDFLGRLILALLGGVVMGALLALFTAVLWALSGVPDEFARPGASILELVIAYVGGGGLGGLVVGLLQGLRRTLFGCGVIGSLAITPGMIWLWSVGSEPLTESDIAGLMLSCVLIGGGLGAYFGQHFARAPETRS